MPEEEMKEAPKEEVKEKSEDTETSSGQVMISEEFQKKVTALVEEYKDSEPCLDFMCDTVQDARDTLRRKEQEKRDAERMKKNPKGKASPQAFSTAEMPD